MSVSEDKMAEWVLEQFKNATTTEKQNFKDAEIRELTIYHNTLGKAIRNHFKLWENKWEPEVEGNVDYSVDHPDAVSMRVIEKAWKKLQK